MSEKVKLTRKQDFVIRSELAKEMTKSTIIKYHIRGNYTSDNPIARENMSTDKLIKALYIGYEVEPEFEVGDWVFIGKEGTQTRKEKVVKVVRIDDFQDLRLEGGWQINMYSKHIRHATPEEIAEEKERRWWKKHGREVWELRKGDLVYVGDDVYVSVETPEGDSFKFRDSENVPWEIEEMFKVVCFAEDRLDVSE